MIRIAALLGLAATSAIPANPRFTRVALACESGCVTADSALVVEALRAGLAQSGVTVVVKRSDHSLPLLVNGRVTVEDGKLKVAAELLEMEREVSRYTVVSPRAQAATDVQRMGARFGRALSPH